jgi:hypothetical protein
VAPGEDDRAARRGDRRGDRVSDRQAVPELLAVAAHEEQGVINPDAEADHGGERRPDRRHVGHMAEKPDQRQPGEQADHGGDDRQSHRHERTECEREDDHRGHEPDHLAALRLRLGQLGPDRAADRDLHPRLSARLSCREDRLRNLLGQLVAADVEQHRDERRLLVGADLDAALLTEGIGRARDLRQLENRRVRGLDRLLVARVGDLAPFRVEDERARAVLLRGELLGEQVGGRLAVRAGKLQVVARVRSDLSDEQHETRSHDKPDGEHDPRTAGGDHADVMQKARHSRSGARRGCPSLRLCGRRALAVANADGASTPV